MVWLPTAGDAWVNDEDETICLVHTVPGGNERVLFACHLDTVHATNGYQRVHRQRDRAHALHTPDGECLGADDGAGIWLMLEMIEAGVPGTYVFHLDEERGCRGSRWLATHRRGWLRGFRWAIGFDRPGTSDVVTHFGGTRGCSPGFALDLAWALSSRLSGYELAPCRTGGITDVRQYIGLIPECTNLSIGYHCQHRRAEWLDQRYLGNLRDAVIEVFGDSESVWAEAVGA
jgi:hypothetical protein